MHRNGAAEMADKWWMLHVEIWNETGQLPHWSIWDRRYRGRREIPLQIEEGVPNCRVSGFSSS